MEITKFQSVLGLSRPNSLTVKKVSDTPGQSFGDTLKNAINEVNKLQSDADESVNSLVMGTETDIHKTMIAMEKAGVSFQLMMQIRNKAIEAYQEMMRMQV